MSKITRNCDWCNSVYFAETRELNRGQGIFCSRSCSGKSRASKSGDKPTNTTCAFCGKEFYRPESKKKSKTGLNFCSREHQRLAVKDSSIPLHTRIAVKDTRPECLDGCGTRTVSTHGRCRSCNVNYKIKLWLEEGNLEVTHCGKVKEPAKWVKTYIVSVRGDKCEICGWDEKAPDGRSIIQMDHKDGNFLNNDPSNLQLLCPNHHAMTHNYGSLNKSGGRAHRRRAS